MAGYLLDRPRILDIYITKEATAYNVVKTVYSINGVGNIGQMHAKK